MKRTSLTSKIISIVLSISLIVSFVPSAAYAEVATSNATTNQVNETTLVGDDVQNEGTDDLQNQNSETNETSLQTDVDATSNNESLNEQASSQNELSLAPASTTVNESNTTVSEGWNQFGTCEWKMEAYKLIIRPLGNGESGMLPSNTSRDVSFWPWYSQKSIDYVEICPGVKATGSLHGMFYGQKYLRGFFQLNLLDTSNVTDMSYMFDYCPSLTWLDLSNFDTSNVTDMSNMFSGCISLKTLDLSSFDTSNVTNMSNMFHMYYVTSSQIFDGGSSLTSLDVSSFDTSNVTNMNRMFYYCSELSSLDVSKWNTSNVTDMSEIFRDCSSLTSLDVSNFDTSSATNMYGMFWSCSSLTSLDVSGFNTSHVTDMHRMFAHCSKLPYVNVSNFDTSNVTDMSDMFSMTFYSGGTYHTESSLVSLDVSNFDTSNATYMNGMFEGCKSLTSLDVSNFDTSKATFISGMFASCSSLTSIDVSKWLTINVGDMNRIFSGCSSLSSLDLSRWNTSKVWNMNSMFSDCSSLTSLDVSTFNTQNVIYMTSIFSGCSSLSSLDLSRWNTSKVTKMSETFNGCSSLKSVSLGDTFVFSTSLFQTPSTTTPYTGKWIAKTGDNKGTIYDASEIPSGVAATYVWDTTTNDLADATVSVDDQEYTGKPLTPKVSVVLGDTVLKENVDYTVEYSNNIQPGWATAKVTGAGIFTGTNKAIFGIMLPLSEDWNEIGSCEWKIDNGKLIIRPRGNGNSGRLPSNTLGQASFWPWHSQAGSITSIEICSGVKGTGSLAYMFEGCASANSINISNLDTMNVTNMSSMFNACSSLDSLDVSKFDTSNVTDMGDMFRSCSSLTSLDVSNFNTINVTDMGGMFSGCSSLDSLDVSDFETENVEDMHSMFSGCSSLSSLDVSDFETAKVPSMNGMFSGCSSLSSLDVSNFDTSNVTDMNYMFDGCTNLLALDASGFDTSSVLGMNSMFNACSSLILLDVSNFNTSNVTNMGYMFYDCASLSSLNLSSFDTSKVAVWTLMFYGTSSLKSVSLGDTFVFSSSPLQSPSSVSPYTGKWIAKTGINEGTVYKASKIPSGVAATYVWDTTTNDLADAAISVENQEYTGKPLTPKPSVVLGETTLTENVDYTVEYSNNTEPGLATVTVTGVGIFTGSQAANFRIIADISGATIASVAAQTYTGSAITPELQISFNGKALVKDTDYALSYENNTNVGTATVSVTGTGNYANTTSTTFEIAAADISGATIASVAAQTYTGSAITPGPQISFNGKALAKDEDYTLEYQDNVDAGTATIIIKGCGNFTGSATTTFTITPADIADMTISKIDNQTYTGDALTPALEIKHGDKILELTSDYTLSYEDNTNVGSATVTIAGIGNYANTTSTTFEIVAADIANVTIASVPNQPYTSKQITPDIQASFNGKTLTKGTDYTLEYENNVNIGTATITVTGCGNFTSTTSTSFEIVLADIANATIVPVATQTYTGEALTPEPQISFNGKALVKDTDYTLEYQDNINAGTAIITITGCGKFAGSTQTNFTITPAGIADMTISKIDNQTYTGDALTPALEIKHGDKTLELTSDYTLSYEDNTNVGSATITITGCGNYTNTTSTTFEIVAANIASATVGEISSQTYTGEALTPEPQISFNGKTLVKDSDYTLSYEDNTNVGQATITITGTGNFTGSTSTTFDIAAANIVSATVGEITSQTYTGEALTPKPQISFNGKTLVKDTDYTLEYQNNTKAGTATITITGTGNFTGITSTSFTILAASIAEMAISKIDNQTYTGEALVPAPEVKHGDKTLVPTSDYTVSYEDNTNVGTATVTITGCGNYANTTSTTFEIAAANIASATVGEISSQTYTGSALFPEPQISFNGKTLVKDSDYTLEYQNNVNAGQATITITGTGNFTGSTSATFEIAAANIASATVGEISSQTYTGEALTPEPKMSFNGKTLVKDTDYTLEYQNNTNAGTATITIKGTGNFTGTTSVQFTIDRAQGTASFENSKVQKVLGEASFTNPLTTNSGGEVTYSSSDASVATVDPTTGLVTIVGAGQATISANVAETQNYTACSASFTLNVANPSISYCTHIQNVGWQEYKADGQMSGTSGEALRLEGIKIKLDNLGGVSGGIEYRTHIQNIGWQGYKSDDQMSGTSGKAYRLEAIDMHLTGDIANYYDVYYRVHAQNVGWMGWAKNGEEAGTAGYAYRLEAIQIVLVAKGEPAPGDVESIHSVVDYAYLSSSEGPSDPYRDELISYNTHVQNIGWQEYSKTGGVAGTSGLAYRLEGIHIKLGGAAAALSGSVEYKTHVQNIGWQNYFKDGEMSGTSGLAYRLEAIKILLTDEVADAYDIYYRVHAQNIGWMGWAKNDESAGTAGYAYRLEAIQIVMKPKGSDAPGRTYGGIKSDVTEAFLEA